MACDSPFYRVWKGEQIPLPCGRCGPCKKRRVDSWVFRLMQEDKVSATSRFITLTYDNDHVPISENGWLTLTKGHDLVPKDDGTFRKVDRCCFTKYIKRLRKLCHGVSVKYYACGEYGSDNRRPHWHAIVFNVPDDEMFFTAWSLDGKPFGKVHVGQVSGDSVAYVMKYIDKPGGVPLFPNWKPFVGRDDRIPEFALMSKGLGESYITPAIKRYHQADLSRMYMVRDGGFKIAMPRYYRERIYTEDERASQGTLAQAAAAKVASDNYAEYLLKYGAAADYDYSLHLQNQREAREISFFNNQKPRSCDD